jgi:hypothetical protein
MTAVVIVKGDDGKLTGLGEKGAKSYAKFLAYVKAMEPGETIDFEWKKPRSLKWHKLFFATLSALFDRQEQFEKLEGLLAWIKVGTGRFDSMPGPTGRMVAIPQSISFASMDDQDFADFFNDVDTFMQTAHFGEFLWPHLSAEKRMENINQLLTEFRSERQ